MTSASGLSMLAALIPALLLVNSVQAESESEIYRCDRAGVITFSDTPCASESPNDESTISEPYVPDSLISVIAPPEDFDEIQAASQRWLQDHRERRLRESEIRSAARNSLNDSVRRTTDSTSPSSQVTSPGVLLWPYRPAYGPHRPHKRVHPVPTPEREQRYSATSGPFPGTRPRRHGDSQLD